MKAKELIRTHARMSDQEFRAAVDGMDPHEKDLLVECKACGAAEGKECKSVKKRKLEKGIVHIGRRIRRLIKGIR